MNKITIAAVALMFALNSEVFSLAVLAVGGFWFVNFLFTEIANHGNY